LPSDVTAAYLLAQLQHLNTVQIKRKALWNQYHNAFASISATGLACTPVVLPLAQHNAHIFYLTLQSKDMALSYMAYMAKGGVETKTHYITLHDSPYYAARHGDRILPNAKSFQHTLVRLPLFYDITERQLNEVITLTHNFFDKH
jgi:dTDP-4-amino-4,6-dideoxygalactose transaminase